MYTSLGRESSSISSAHLNKPKHPLCVMGCDTLTPIDMRLSNIQQTTNPFIARPLSGSPNCAS